MLNTHEQQLETALSCANIAVANLEFVYSSHTTETNSDENDAIKIALCSIKTTSAVLSALITNGKDKHSDGGGGRGRGSGSASGSGYLGKGRGKGRGYGFPGKGGRGKGGNEKDNKKFVFIGNHVLKKDKYDSTSMEVQEYAVEKLKKDFQVDDVNVTHIDVNDNGLKVFFDSSEEIMDKTTYGHGSNSDGWMVNDGTFIFFKERKFNPSSSSATNEE
jgi:hypothetical protein